MRGGCRESGDVIVLTKIKLMRKVINDVIVANNPSKDDEWRQGGKLDIIFRVDKYVRIHEKLV